MRTVKALALATALATAGTPMVAEAGGRYYRGGGYGSGFWAGVGVVGGLIGLGILADALTRPDVVYVNQPPAYYPPAPGYYYPPDAPPAESAPPGDYDSPPPGWESGAADEDTRERDAYFAGYAAGRDDAADDEPYYPGPRAVRARR